MVEDRLIIWLVGVGVPPKKNDDATLFPNKN